MSRRDVLIQDGCEQCASQAGQWLKKLLGIGNTEEGVDCLRMLGGEGDAGRAAV